MIDGALVQQLADVPAGVVTASGSALGSVSLRVGPGAAVSA